MIKAAVSSPIGATALPRNRRRSARSARRDSRHAANDVASSAASEVELIGIAF
jgi:hypothetical protein